MNRPFIHDDFLLSTPTARRLYHEIAAPLPIIDYHNHLDAALLAEDRPFENLARLWIVSDPYKHRAMRIVGVPEADITGPADDYTKFIRWAQTVPKTIGSPLHHWTALELKRFFDISEPLNESSADRIWAAANERLQSPELSPRAMLTRLNVKCVCTSDRLLDDLTAHEQLGATRFDTEVLPSLRADDLIAVDRGGFNTWLNGLGGQMTLDEYQARVTARLDAFDRLGCRLADHGLDDFRYQPLGAVDLDDLFARRLDCRPTGENGLLQLKSYLLHWLGSEYARRGWVMQLHLGAQRSTSSRLLGLAGPAGGYASIGNAVDVPSLCQLLNGLEAHDRLPRTILYNLNPTDNAALATLTGSFAEDGVAGKIQLGPAWWYNDHALGIRNHLDALAGYGLLWTFIGFTTDSRSFLSLVRHEYFRRIACDWIGEQVATGAVPDDRALLNGLVEAICYRNAAETIP